jgi:hypothetical protein
VTDDDRPRPKKSWREIDKMRDHSGGPSRRDQRDRDSFERSTGYTKYKTNLERLFSGGAPLPEHLRGKGAEGEEEGDEERKRLFAIEDTKAFHAAASEYLKKNPIPDDPRLLDRLLGHPDEDVVEKSLGRLEELHKAGTLKAPPALPNRLASVEIDSGDPKIRRRAAELRKALR